VCKLDCFTLSDTSTKTYHFLTRRGVEHNLATLAWCVHITFREKCRTVTNTLAYFVTGISAAAKRFVVWALGWKKKQLKLKTYFEIGGVLFWQNCKKFLILFTLIITVLTSIKLLVQEHSADWLLNQLINESLIVSSTDFLPKLVILSTAYFINWSFCLMITSPDHFMKRWLHQWIVSSTDYFINW
jgi:hypothetical protein